MPVETLIDRQIDSYNDAMHILFELSEKYALVPVEIPQEPKYVIQTKNEVILQALEAWYNKRRKWENGDITQAELQEWMDAFPLQCEENESPAEKGESRYTDFERIMGLKSALEQMDMIVNDNVELIEDCIAHKNYKTAREHLRTLKATVHTLSQVDSNDTENKEITGYSDCVVQRELFCDFCYLGSIEQRSKENSKNIPISSFRLRPV